MTTGAFFANLNAFLACFVLLEMFVGRGVAYPLAMGGFPALGILPASAVRLAVVLSHLVTLSVLLAFWVRTGLVPSRRDPSRAWRYRNGHRLVAVTTGLFVMTRVVTALEPASAPVWLMVLFLSYAVWPIGLWMIWSSAAAAKSSAPPPARARR